MDIKKILLNLKKGALKWYKNHSNALDTVLDFASDCVPGGKIIINILKGIKAVYDDEQYVINQQISQEQIIEINNFIQNIQPVIINLVDDIEDLKEFKKSGSLEERKKILLESSFRDELDKVLPKIASSLTETVNKTKSISSRGLINNLYLKLEILGHGGQGTVYKCINTFNDLVVAVKVIPDQLSSNQFSLLKKEYHRIIKKLVCPNIVQYRELSIDKNTHQCYIVMDYLEGVTLRSLMIKKRLSGDKVFTLDETVSLLTGIAKALDHAHNNNVLHLDLKPENILIDPNNVSYLFDFGLSEDLQHTLLSSQTNPNTTSKGTLAYMAPEQYKGKKTGVQTDIWAFGVIIYEMLSGRHPFNGRSFEHFYKLVCEEELEEIEEVSDNVNNILRQSLSKKRKERLSGATEILNRLIDTKKAVVIIEDTKINQVEEVLSYKEDPTETDSLITGTKKGISDDKNIQKHSIEEIPRETKHTILQNNINKDLSANNQEVFKDIKIEQISLELPEIEGSFFKIYGKKKTKISSGNILLATNTDLEVKVNTAEDIKKIIKLSDLILNRIKSLDFSFYKETTFIEIKELSVLKNLEYLNLASCNKLINDIFLNPKIFKNLKYLSISSLDYIRDNELISIAQFKNLETLNLLYCLAISNKGLKYISKLKKLQTLDLTGCDQITDIGLKYISYTQNLQNLYLSDCNQITDKGLKFIAQLQNLQTLQLYRCKHIRDSGIKKLQEQLKFLKIYR